MALAIIRPIERKDKEEWIELFSGKDSYLLFYKSELPQETVESTFERFFDDSIPVYAFVAVDARSGRLIGFATYLTHYNTWSTKLTTYLNDLFVKPDCRLKGTGRLLINAVYNWADKEDSDKVYWHTQFENHRAQMLYTRVGKKAGFLSYVRPHDNQKPDYYS